LGNIEQTLIESIQKIVPEEAKSALVQGLNSIFSSLDEEQINGFRKAFSEQGKEWGFQSSHPVATEILLQLVGKVIGIIPLGGKEHAVGALNNINDGKTVVMVGNHLSYGDVNFLHAQCELNGIGKLPLLVMAGPKVYEEPFRILSSMAFDSLKMAQPPSKASEGAEVSRRELLQITRLVVEDAIKWQDNGRILYFFPEGTRTRTGELNSFIHGVSRYIEREGTLIYPVGYTGTDGLVGVDSNDINFSNAQMNFGAPIDYDQTVAKIKAKYPEANVKKFMVDLLGFHIADLIEKENRGYYQFPYNKNPDLREVEEFYLTER